MAPPALCLPSPHPAQGADLVPWESPRPVPSPHPRPPGQAGPRMVSLKLSRLHCLPPSSPRPPQAVTPTLQVQAGVEDAKDKEGSPTAPQRRAGRKVWAARVGETRYCSPPAGSGQAGTGNCSPERPWGLGEVRESPLCPHCNVPTDSALGGIAGPPPSTPRPAGRRQLIFCAHLPVGSPEDLGAQSRLASCTPLASPSFLRSPADCKTLAQPPPQSELQGPPSSAPSGGWPAFPEAGARSPLQ